MKTTPFIFITAILLIFTACKPETNSNTEKVSDPSVNNVNPDLGKNINSPINVRGLRAQALSILNHRLKKFPDTYAIIESEVWEYQFVFDGKMSPLGRYKGVWIDFKDDHTYEYGTKDKVEGGGRYNYHLDRGELVLVDSDDGRKPQEFVAKVTDAVMVLEGTATYNDRHIQMKLEKAPQNIKDPK